MKQYLLVLRAKLIKRELKIKEKLKYEKIQLNIINIIPEMINRKPYVKFCYYLKNERAISFFQKSEQKNTFLNNSYISI